MNKKTIGKLLQGGNTYAEIGKAFGVTRQRVHQIYKNYISPSDQRKKTRRAKILAELVEKYKSTPQKEPKKIYAGILEENGLAHLEGRDRARMMTRIRDDFTCQDCGVRRTNKEVFSQNKKQKGLIGKIKNLDVHHTHDMCGKNSIGYDSIEDISKMITLCHRCHFNRPEHKTKRKKRERLEKIEETVV